jgi:hypothetical protein
LIGANGSPAIFLVASLLADFVVQTEAKDVAFVSESVIDKSPSAIRQRIEVQQDRVIGQMIIKIFDLGAPRSRDHQFGAAAASKTDSDVIVAVAAAVCYSSAVSTNCSRR